MKKGLRFISQVFITVVFISWVRLNAFDSWPPGSMLSWMTGTEQPCPCDGRTQTVVGSIEASEHLCARQPAAPRRTTCSNYLIRSCLNDNNNRSLAYKVAA